MSILTTIESEVSKLAPTALAVVASIESSLKSAAGTTKKAIAVTIIGNLAKIAEGTGIPLAAEIGNLVDVIVGVLNATGLFTHATPPAAPGA